MTKVWKLVVLPIFFSVLPAWVGMNTYWIWSLHYRVAVLEKSQQVILINEEKHRRWSNDKAAEIIQMLNRIERLENDNR